MLPILDQRTGLTIFASYDRISGRGELWTTEAAVRKVAS